MRKTLKLALLTALILPLFAACGGGSPANKLMDHMDKVVTLLEQNATDAAKAEAAVTAYMKDNQAEMQKLATEMATKMADVQKEMEAKMKDAKPEDMADLAQEMMSKMGIDADMMKRGNDLDARRKKVMEDHPELKDNAGLTAQLEAIDGMMKEK